MNKTLLPLAFGTIATITAAMPAYASDYQVEVTNLTAGIHFTPLIVSAHNPQARMFHAGSAASAELQAIAEGGDVSSMASLLESIGAAIATGDGLIAPGGTASFSLSSTNPVNSVLSITGMLLPTNDGFIGLDSVHLPANRGDSMTFFARAYDAGTEANDEVVGSGAPGQAGFPAPPPVVATGTGTGGTGVHAPVEGVVTVHRGIVGDLDPEGGVSDINAAVHQWHNPVARITITQMGGSTNTGGPSEVASLTGEVYSRSALELFWEAATSADSAVTGYEVFRNGESVRVLDGTSFFDEGLDEATDYSYEVRAIDANGNSGPGATIMLRTNG